LGNQVILFLGIIGAGLAVALYLFFKEMKQGDSQNAEPISPPDAAATTEPPSILHRLGITETAAKDMGLTIPTKSKETPVPLSPLTSGKETIPPENKDTVDLNKMAVAELSHLELQAKYDKAEATIKEKDTLLQRKDEELQKNEKALMQELKEKKEFNKTKDLLEKEIKELKDKNHKSLLELTASKAETESYRNRITQLEEKLNGREKDLKTKEKDIEELAKRLQVFAKPSPDKATVPETPAQIKETPKPVTPEAKKISEDIVETPQTISEQKPIEPPKPRQQEVVPATAEPQAVSPEPKQETIIPSVDSKEKISEPLTEAPKEQASQEKPKEQTSEEKPKEELPLQKPNEGIVAQPIEIQPQNVVEKAPSEAVTPEISSTATPISAAPIQTSPEQQSIKEKTEEKPVPQKPKEPPKTQQEQKPKEEAPNPDEPKLHLYSKILEMKHKNMLVKKQGETQLPEKPPEPSNP